MNSLEDKLQAAKIGTSAGIKKHIFDWVSAIIIVALIAACMDVFDLIDFKTIDLFEFFISWFPYFAAAILLHNNLYNKGVFIGKTTGKFIKTIEAYGDIANSLSGEQIKNLYPFCDKYNEDVKKSMQTQTLRKEGVTFEEFEHGTKELPPLKTCSKKFLIQKGYNKEQIKAIRKAKKLHVHGINVSILLSSINVKDVTCIGDDEKTLQTKHMISSTLLYALSTLLLSIMAVKDISEWGWMGLILTLFKVAYLFAGSYTSYFKGYDNITINLVNHFSRKIDILKMYLDYKPEEDT